MTAGQPPPARSILVTGANGALGLAVARGFLNAEPGARLFLGVRSNRSHADDLVAAHPHRCQTLNLDVTDPQAWSAAIAEITSTTGRIDVLVNNAGFHHDALLATMDDETWRSVLAANLDGVFFGCRAVARPMIAQRQGRIVNVASLSALLAPAGQTNYAAAKAAVVALSQSLAKELARATITVNTVCPGYLDTNALDHLDPGQRKTLTREIPMRRLGTPDEAAAAVRFLASPDASYITGAVLKVDGGIL